MCACQLSTWAGSDMPEDETVRSHCRKPFSILMFERGQRESKSERKPMCYHLCFQAKMSDESPLAPHPRLSGVKCKWKMCHTSIWYAGCCLAWVVPDQSQSNFRTVRPAHCGYDCSGNCIGHGLPPQQQRCPWGTLALSLSAVCLAKPIAC